MPATKHNPQTLCPIVEKRIMNILFHTATAIGVSVLLTDTQRIKPDSTINKSILTSLAAFAVGVVTHAALDYMPHCYPINSKVDAIVSLIIIVAVLFYTRKPYKLIVGFSFLGCIFPDILDLMPSIINKYTGLSLPITDKLFPWHWREFSGIISSDNCIVSAINQILLIISVGIICWFRRTDLKRMIRNNRA